MTFSIDEDKTIWQIKHPVIIKIPRKVGIKGNFLNLIKGNYKKAIANIVLQGGRLYMLFP